ncbi:hypothetical protein JCM11491_005906 [Sporobolomyces phaffii]
MAKSANPVDAHRKAQRAKELKKNKQNRSKAKEISTVKKDTRPIEQEIRQLSSKGNLSKPDKDHLASLRAEVARINKAKSDYVEAHPEHRKFIFPERPSDHPDGGDGDEPRGLYDKTGKLKHPERSIYYDPVFNPFGAPPPGMPYREKPEFTMQRLGIPTPAELAAFNPIGPEGSDEESDEDDSGDDDDDIEMPAGPPPGEKKSAAESDSESDSSDDDDDIPMPPGPPPPRPSEQPTSSRVHIPRPSSRPSQPHPRTHPHPPNPHSLPPRPPFLPPPPHAPTGPRNPHHLPSRPPPPPQHMSDPMNLGDAGPHRAYQQGAGPQLPPGPAPPGPSSSATISAGPSPFLPIGVPGGSSATAAAGATISAAPQLRDLKKEATAFLPAAMRKKQQAAKAKLERVGLSKVDAARGGGGAGGGATSEGVEEETGVVLDKGPSLMESLKARGVGETGGFAGSLPPPQNRKHDEDYRKFEEDMKEFL